MQILLMTEEFQKYRFLHFQNGIHAKVLDKLCKLENVSEKRKSFSI